MNCPNCKSRDTQVSQTRRFESSIMRVRTCCDCLWVFKTWEEPDDGGEGHVNKALLEKKIKEAESNGASEEIEEIGEGRKELEDVFLKAAKKSKTKKKRGRPKKAVKRDPDVEAGADLQSGDLDSHA